MVPTEERELVTPKKIKRPHQQPTQTVTSKTECATTKRKQEKRVKLQTADCLPIYATRQSQQIRSQR